MTMTDLPPPDTKRWVPRIKATIVAAVEGGLISRDEAMKRYYLSDEEFDVWKAAFSRDGMLGLKVTKISRNRAHRASHRGHASKSAAGMGES